MITATTIPAAEGSTRQRLLDVAEALVDEVGPSAVSLREIARRAGVSHAAPLKHFPTLSRLFAELATVGFDGLHDAVAAGVARADADSTGARLAHAGDAYVRYAVARPGRFALMFRFDLLDPEHVPVQVAAWRAWQQLVDLVDAHRAAGWRTTTPVPQLAGALWSAVHGTAQLWSTRALPATTGAEDLDAQIAALHALLDLPSIPTTRSPRRARAATTPRRRR